MNMQINIGRGNILAGTDIRTSGPDRTEGLVDMISESNEKLSKVFIIHGHNEAKWRELASILRELKVEPIELSEQTLNGRTIIEKFEYYAEMCTFAFAVFTYDDVVHKDNGEEYFQVRPNVIFELGWFYAKLGREKVMIIEEENAKSNIFSDLAGIYRYKFHRDISERYREIKTALKEAGIS